MKINNFFLYLILTLLPSILLGQSNLPHTDSIRNDKKNLKPIVKQLSAIDITSHSVTLRGIVNPQGSTTYAYFVIPANSPIHVNTRKNGVPIWLSLINQQPIQLQNVGSSWKDVFMLPITLNGLNPNTTYFYLIAAANANGTSTFPPRINVNENSFIKSDWLSFTTKAETSNSIMDSLNVVTLPPHSIANEITFNGFLTSAYPHNRPMVTYFLMSTNKDFLEPTNKFINEKSHIVNTYHAGDTLCTMFNANFKWVGAIEGEFKVTFLNLLSKPGTLFFVRAAVYIIDKKWEFGEILEFHPDSSQNDDSHTKSNVPSSINTIYSSTNRNKKSTGTQINIYKQNRTRLQTQINILNNNIKIISKDPTYSLINLEKIYHSKLYFDDIDYKINTSSQQELQSVNNLIEDLTETIKILILKKGIKNDTLFYKKYEYLMRNINELHEFIMNEKQGYNSNTNKDNEIQLCYSGSSIQNFFPFNENSNSNSNEDCSFGVGFPVKIFSVQLDSLGNKIQKNNLTVNYKYSLEVVSTHAPHKYGKLTSPSCEKVLPGIYDFWLTDSFSKNKQPVSEIKEVDLTRIGKEVMETEIKIVEIPLFSK